PRAGGGSWRGPRAARQRLLDVAAGGVTAGVQHAGHAMSRLPRVGQPAVLAVVADLEFFQFHPTAFAGPGGWRFLISEAVRGHGAVLRNQRGEAFMSRYDARAELAPRDVVSRSIVREMTRQGLSNVWLDATAFAPGEFARRFPTIDAHCRRQGCDPE